MQITFKMTENEWRKLAIITLAIY